jgi:3-dehydroquinate synthase
MMGSVRTITVEAASGAYPALIESGLLRRAGEVLRERLPGRSQVFVITAPPVRRRWGRTMAASLKAAGWAHHSLEMGDGERHKSLRTVAELAGKLVDKGADRRAVILALGGGVVGDVAGFLAAIYMRGIDVVQAPTTLLAQVDAAIGGKTGVDLPQGKNLLGSFHQPRAVLIDPAVLATLPEREYRAGLFEALKYGVIRRRAIFEFMEQKRECLLRRDPEALEWLIGECVQVKAGVVAADEREGGLRRILNFGHTIGHALEAESGYKGLRHGEAVAWGMVAAARIAAALQKSSAETAQRIVSAVLAYGPLPRVQARGKRVVRRLVADKKTVDGVAHFVLPTELGKVAIVADVPERAVVEAVEELGHLWQQS